MMDYKNILLATDLSKQSDKIAQRAKDIAEQCNASLSVVYTMEHSPIAYGGEYSIPIDANLEESLENNARDSLAKLGNKFSIDKKNQHLASGSVKLAIIDTAEEIGADLIVIGAHSHHGLEALLGSRAGSILNHAKCDVLVVRVQ